MSDISQLDGRKLSVIVVQEDGVPRGHWLVLKGIAKQREGQLFLDRGPDQTEIPISEEMLPRVRRVASELLGILGDPEYSILLTLDWNEAENCLA